MKIILESFAKDVAGVKNGMESPNERKSILETETWVFTLEAGKKLKEARCYLQLFKMNRIVCHLCLGVVLLCLCDIEVFCSVFLSLFINCMHSNRAMNPNISLKLNIFNSQKLIFSSISDSKGKLPFASTHIFAITPPQKFALADT